MHITYGIENVSWNGGLSLKHAVYRNKLAIGGLWIGKWICWTVNNHNFKRNRGSLQFAIECTGPLTLLCCHQPMVDGGRSPSSGLPNSPRASDTATLDWLANQIFTTQLHSSLADYSKHLAKFAVILLPTVSRPVNPDVRLPSGGRDQLFVFL